ANQPCLIWQARFFQGPSHSQVADQAARKSWYPAESANRDHRSAPFFCSRLTAAAGLWRRDLVFVVPADPGHGPRQGVFVAAFRRHIEEIVGADENIEPPCIR